MSDSYIDFVSGGLGKSIASKLGLPRPVKLRRHSPEAPLVAGPVLVLADDASLDDAGAIAEAMLPWGVDVRRTTHLGAEDRWGAVVVVLTEMTHPRDLADPALELGSTLRRLGKCARVITVSRSTLSSPSPNALSSSPSSDALSSSPSPCAESQGPAPRHGSCDSAQDDTSASAQDDTSVAAQDDTAATAHAGMKGSAWNDPHGPAVRAARGGVSGLVRSLAKELRMGATANGIRLAEHVSVTAPSSLGALRFLLSAKSAFVDGQFMDVSDDGVKDPSWERPLEGKVAAVTGAARGIGAEIARVLSRDGATVVAVDVPAAGDSLAAVANAIHGTALQLDVTAADAAQRISEHARARHGRLDIVIHNAGILRDKLLANMSEDKWRDLIAVNIAAPLSMNEEFVRLASEGALGESPRVVSLASTSGIAGNRGQTNYGTAKAGIIAMTEALAPLLAAAGGTANAVAPGFIETEMTAKIPPVARQVARRVSSLQQGGLPVDVAEAIAFLCSPAASGINGTTLRVCGQNIVGQ